MDTLIHIKEEMSLAIIAGISYPIVEVTNDFVTIAATSSQTAKNISTRTGGEIIDTNTKEFPFEIHIEFKIFDRVLQYNTWAEMINELLTIND